MLGYKHIESLQNDDEHIVEERVRNEIKTENTTMKESINDSKDSDYVTDQKAVTWVEVVKNKTRFQKDDQPAILLKQSSSKKI